MGSQPSAPAGEDVRVALDAFRRIVQALRSSARDAERRVGISTAQLFALHQLASSPGASVNELAARTFTHQSSVSVVVQRLVKQRLVAKVTANEDRRRVRLALTDAGRGLLRRSPEPVQDRLIAGLGALTEAQRRVLTTALCAIADTLSGGEAAPPMLFEDGVAAARRRGRRTGRPHDRSAARVRRGSGMRKSDRTPR
jgi:MarR family transcriptional regulator, lower aerobic nicotinate degradation pathway regulator